MLRVKALVILVARTIRNLGIGVETKKKIETLPKEYLYNFICK